MDSYLKKQRFTKANRQLSGITAHKILEIGKETVTIAVPMILSATGSVSIPMGETSGLQVGNFLDFQFSYTVRNGKVNDYRCQYLGETPPQFVPSERA